MNKIVNFRLPVFLALALCAGIGTGLIFRFFGYDLILLWFTAPAAVILTCTVYIIKRSLLPVLYALIAVITFCGGFFTCYNKIEEYEKPDIAAGESYFISGNVTEITDYENRKSFIIDGVKISGKKYGFKILVNCYGEAKHLEEGNFVSFESTLARNDIFAYGIFSYNAANDIKYSCSVESFNAEYRFDLFAAARAKIRETLYDNLDGETAGVCYAMLTGNTGNVDEGTLSSFRYGGIAHIFAVSGLPVSIVFAILDYICKKLRINKWAATILCLALVFTYSGICGFTSSSLRAAVTCAVLKLARNAFLKYDSLNALALSVLVLLFINPFFLFTAGFLLSVCAVGGICVFSKLVQSALTKIKIPEKLSSAAGAAVGAQIGVFPVMLSSFGYVSGAGLLLNFLILPLLTLVFNLIFIGTAISCLIPAVAPFVLPTAVLPLELILSFLVGAGFENALIKGFGAGAFCLLFFLGALFISDKINFKASARIFGAACSAGVIIAYVLLCSAAPFSGCEIIVSAYYRGGEVLIKSRTASVLIVTEDAGAHVTKTLNGYYCAHLDGVIILGGDDAVSAFYPLDTGCGNLYLFSQPPVQPYGNTLVHYERFFEIGKISFAFENNYSISFKCEGVEVCVCAGGVPYKKADLLITELPAPDCISENKIYFHNPEYPLNINKNGDCVYTAKDGKIKLNGKKRP